ncbi:arsenate reductase ArsC [Clostridium boliviensis]|uniref:Arsenate reductase ArsC n=1 Tax=Clostridium boliviensis TaxID=318465 RepID=A0ABU4GNP2_9CLOT|nr:arsenate reductase ArsC [Clostridium boliviensis]MDW2799239.1 arsenate reductase ArsC [Clostridium boliviensis]
MEREKIKVLFVCVSNSFRSQIADAILNHKYGGSFVAESAGFRKKSINPLAIEVMKEYGLDISNKSVDELLDFYNQGRKYDYVITVCNRGEEEDCPIFPGNVTRLSWREFRDPDDFTGTEEEKLEMARKLRDDIAKRIDEFVNTVK